MPDRRRGPAGMLVGLIGAGVGAATEYHEHRKEQKQQKLSRENSQQSENLGVGSSSAPQQSSRDLGPSSGAPPVYEDVPNNNRDRFLASGGPVADEKKQDLSQYDEDDDSDDSISTEEDEEDWELDEVGDRALGKDPAAPPSYVQSEADYRSTDELVQDVMLHSQSAARNQHIRPHEPLPLPVILPQRRPGTKARGFVRAYAPVLDNSGIDQDTFMSFLDNFDKSSQASPIFTVIQVSAAIAGFAPSVIAMAVTTAVQVAAKTGAEIQARQRTNHFLDQVNEDLFKPAGLYAFIMKYKPDSENNQSLAARFGFSSQVVDLSTSQTIAKYARTISGDSNASRTMGDRMKDLRLGSGTTHGSLRLPEAAPLIFPAIDAAILQDGAEETFKTKAKGAKLFLADYVDRRSQMKYAANDPDSALNVPQDQRALKSKLADPNHPMWQGGLINMATGGYLEGGKQQYRSSKRFDRDERRVLRYEQRMDQGRRLSRKKQNRLGYAERGNDSYGDAGYGRRRRRGRGGLIGGLIGAATAAASGSSSSSSRPVQNEYAQNEYGQRDARATGSEPLAPPAMYQRYSRHSQREGRGGGRGGAIGAVKRIMKEDVLYLMIVNMPSEAELAEARQELARIKSP
ncbi:hypothetical protein LTR78_005254 [Recurvomyces mirabilis]|uniref:Uncharacterized protein n=1 Tax=Recurvomyces mirabilis TaxID=574656 RepID=A0AAE1C1U2_9PEZI|nr:hypothetical protein LTR78_005254 [Recurvomyces mirabilis]KAK5157804.1 hypothetical protein LTS14_003726 [Recurvomyces mirabilis]